MIDKKLIRLFNHNYFN